MKDIAARVPLSLIGQPNQLAPLYEGSGDQGVLGLVVRNDGWEEVRGNLIVEFEGKENGIKYTTPNSEFVCAQRSRNDCDAGSSINILCYKMASVMLFLQAVM